MLPIVLVPGLLCTSEVFSAQIRPLWPFGPVTIASTLEGGTMAEIAGAILAAAPPRFALGGISMGGYIAFEIFRQAPERVERLALISTTARPDTAMQTAQRRAMLAAVRGGDFASAVREAARAIVHPAHADDPQIIATSERMAVEIGVEGFARQTEAIIGRADSRPTLASIRIPTSILVGDRDPLAPPDRAREMAEGIANSRLVIIPECGHASTLEQPQAVSRALVEWIAG